MVKILAVDVKDVRFPTSLQSDGSDAMHTDPDYSCAYVTIKTDSSDKIEGNGLTFTCGRGTEIIVEAVKSLSYLLIGKSTLEIYKDFAAFWRSLTSESQMRWIGPEKGVIHLATAAIINALWDLWGKIEKKPIWRLLADLEPEAVLSVIDFRYITNCITKVEALELLKRGQINKETRIEYLLKNGYPCYTTQAGWLGYSDEKIKELARKYLNKGYTVFKIKVGKNLQDDVNRCKLLREIIGYNRTLLVDANQVWEVPEAIEWMKLLAPFKPLWIEEPTSPDDVLGHAEIAKALKPFGIGVATGEMCCNRVLFKQFLQAEAMEFCQIDSARIGGINEILSVYLMAHKSGVKVCPHAGGVGLCEMVQHLQMWDFVALSGTSEGRFVEFVDQQHEHFVDPCVIKNAHYMAPTAPGYSTTMKAESLAAFEYPHGSEWVSMFAKGLFPSPKNNCNAN